jgi:hypothetical protein
MTQSFFNILRSLLIDWKEGVHSNSESNINALRQAVKSCPDAWQESASLLTEALDSSKPIGEPNTSFKEGAKGLFNFMEPYFAKGEERLNSSAEQIIKSLHQNTLRKFSKEPSAKFLRQIRKVAIHWSQGEHKSGDDILHEILRGFQESPPANSLPVMTITTRTRELIDSLHTFCASKELPHQIKQAAEKIASIIPEKGIDQLTANEMEKLLHDALQGFKVTAFPGYVAKPFIAEAEKGLMSEHFSTREAALLEKEGMLGYAKRLMTHRWTGKDPLPATGEHAGATLEQFGHTALEGKLEKGLAVAGGAVAVGAIVQGGTLMAQGLTGYTDRETGEKKTSDVTRLMIGAGELGAGAAGLLFTATGRMKFWKPLQAVAGRVA